MASQVVYAPRGVKIASRLLQVGLLEPSWAQVGSKLVPSLLKLGSCWAQAGSNLAHVGPMRRSPATPGPTQALPDPFPAASWSPKPPGPKMDSKRPSQASNLDPKPPTCGPKHSKMDSKSLPDLTGPQILLAQAWRNGA